MSDPRTTAEIEADIQRQRDHLADTVDQLSQKLDVKAQARQRAATLKARVTDGGGRPRPEVVVGAVVVVAVVAGMVWWRRR